MTTIIRPSGSFMSNTRKSVTYNYPGPYNSNTLSDRKVSKWNDTFTGIENPSHKAQILSETSATTPASGEKVTIDSWPIMFGTIEAHYGTKAAHNYLYRYYTISGEPLGSIPTILPSNRVDTPTLNRVTAHANSMFLSKAKSAISSFQSGQDIAELKQTIESVLHPMKSLQKTTLSYISTLSKVKNKFKTVRNLSDRNHGLKKALADTYLEWTFGWAPLAADIAQGITDLGKTRFNSVPVESHASEGYSSTDSYDYGNGIESAFYVAHRVVTSYYSIRLKGVVNAYYNGTQPSLAQELQLLPEDFAPTAWNVLPYSFVVDYFLNIGDVIEAYSFPSAALRWCNKSTRDSTKTVISFDRDTAAAKAQFLTGPSPYTIDQHDIWCANFSATNFLFTRSAITASSLIPPLVIEIPKVSAKPWLNIAALLTGSLKRILPFY